MKDGKRSFFNGRMCGMILGIGCDLCGIQRIQKILCGEHGSSFARRVFGPGERELLLLDCLDGLTEPQKNRCFARAAAGFAAKEAFLKAAGTGLSGPFSLCEIEALRRESGEPYLRFSGNSEEWVRAKNIEVRLSLSHEEGFAMAFCVLEEKNG